MLENCLGILLNAKTAGMARNNLGNLKFPGLHISHPLKHQNRFQRAVIRHGSLICITTTYFTNQLLQISTSITSSTSQLFTLKSSRNMALISAATIITSLSLFHITLAFFFLTSPAVVADQTLVFIIGEAMGLVSVLSLKESAQQKAN